MGQGAHEEDVADEEFGRARQLSAPDLNKASSSRTYARVRSLSPSNKRMDTPKATEPASGRGSSRFDFRVAEELPLFRCALSGKQLSTRKMEGGSEEIDEGPASSSSYQKYRQAFASGIRDSGKLLTSIVTYGLVDFASICTISGSITRTCGSWKFANGGYHGTWGLHSPRNEGAEASEWCGKRSSKRNIENMIGMETARIAIPPLVGERTAEGAKGDSCGER